MTTELEKFNKQKNTKKGREFYRKLQVKTFTGAHNKPEHIPMFNQATKKWQFNRRTNAVIN